MNFEEIHVTEPHETTERRSTKCRGSIHWPQSFQVQIFSRNGGQPVRSFTCRFSQMLTVFDPAGTREGGQEEAPFQTKHRSAFNTMSVSEQLIPHSSERR